MVSGVLQSPREPEDTTKSPKSFFGVNLSFGPQCDYLQHFRLESGVGIEDAGRVRLGHVEAGQEVQPRGDLQEEPLLQVGQPAGGLQGGISMDIYKCSFSFFYFSNFSTQNQIRMVALKLIT